MYTNTYIPYLVLRLAILKRRVVCRAQKLMGTADLVLCPYNYIIDPSIRDAMSIELTNSIIIFDEAHNIEDVCRDAGSSITSAHN